MVNCWIVTEGMAGTENQCLGVTDALGIAPAVHRIALRQPWKSLTPYLPFEQACTFKSKLIAPWPDLLITSGRKAVAGARYIKKQNPRLFTVHLQDPRCGANIFDLVAVPHHDALRGDNVIVTDGAPNRITPEKLSSAPHPAPSDKPCVGVLIGGDSKTHKLTSSVMDYLAADLQFLARDYKLLVTMSRRTRAAQAQILRDALEHTDAFVWDGAGENPYFGILAHAQWLLVTNDSASMLSDAATAGKPVYLLPLRGGSAKFARLHTHFKELGIARDYFGVLENWSYPPLRDAQKIADSIRKASGLF